MPAQGWLAGDGGVYRPLPRDYENRIPVPLKTLLEYPGLPQDKLALARREYLQAGAMPSHTRYGWVHVAERAAADRGLRSVGPVVASPNQKSRRQSITSGRSWPGTHLAEGRCRRQL